MAQKKHLKLQELIFYKYCYNDCNGQRFEWFLFCLLIWFESTLSLNFHRLHIWTFHNNTNPSKKKFLIIFNTMRKKESCLLKMNDVKTRCSFCSVVYLSSQKHSSTQVQKHVFMFSKERQSYLDRNNFCYDSCNFVIFKRIHLTSISFTVKRTNMCE